MIQHTLQIGNTLQNGKYKILSLLGQGGFGITYLASYPLMDKKVAIKELFLSGYCVRNTQNASISLQGMQPEDYSKFKERFIDEAKILHNLRNPYLVWVQDMFEENGTVYFVMDYIQGVSLRDVVKQRGKLSESETLNLILQVAEALETVHSKMLLHRDIKPENIIITSENKAVLIDFGNARTFSDGKTNIHSAFITPGYAPPEQYFTKEHRGFYIDIYALGATLYNCATGKAPVPSIERQFSEAPFEGLQNLSPKLRTVIEKAVALKPENRYQTVAEFMNALMGGESGVKENADKLKTTVLENNEPITLNLHSIKIPEMVFVKGGSFNMGSNLDADEKPIHKVELSDFYIGKFTVTNEEFAVFMNEYGSNEIKNGFHKEKKIIEPHEWGLLKKNRLWKPVQGKEKYPIIGITWYGADEYCNWLSNKTGKKFQLPTEAQWEYAAGGGSETRTIWAGTNIENRLGEYAWFYDNSEYKIGKKGFWSSLFKVRATHEVGLKKANDLGIYDMSGNVWEWCLDWHWYDKDFYMLQSKNLINNEQMQYNAIRGGSSYSFASECRVAIREGKNPNIYKLSLGFRVVLLP